MLNRSICIASLMWLGLEASAQDGVVIGGEGAVPDPSALLDLQSTQSGLLIPRMTEAERNAISSPPAGLSVITTDQQNRLAVFSGSSWVEFPLAGQQVGDLRYWDGTRWVIIPAGTPGQFLQLSDNGIPVWVTLSGGM